MLLPLRAAHIYYSIRRLTSHVLNFWNMSYVYHY
ncbi:hypothetical protein ACUY4Q_004605 [Phytobacter sp. AG2a]